MAKLFLLALICALLCVVIAGSTPSSTCGSSLSKTLLTINSIGNIVYLNITSPYQVEIVAGDKAIAWINGTAGARASIFSYTTSALLSFSEDITNTGNTPVATSSPVSSQTPIRVSTANSISAIDMLVLGFVGAIRVLSKKGLLILAVIIAALSMIGGIETRSSSQIQCAEAVVTLQLPVNQVRFICINDQECICGPGFSGDECLSDFAPMTPVTSPVANPPVDDTPVSEPVSEPVAAPVESPVEAPVETPVEAPIEAPVNPPVDECQDEVLNGDETDIDCGGSSCEACTLGKNCESNSDCAANLLCVDNTCDVHCNSGQVDGDETDFDCGGSCDGCPQGSNCNANSDCEGDLVCVNNVCQEHCFNGIKDSDETDIDCGGSLCDGCQMDEICSNNGDCASTNPFCVSGRCKDHCQNGIKDEDESDVDCGGSACGVACNMFQTCNQDSDCNSDFCYADTLCYLPSCVNGQMDGDEMDVDCGGSCMPCS
jgi:hypothetical protein